MEYAFSIALSFFCHDTYLVSNHNITVHRFGLQHECQTALEQLKNSKNLFYCDGSQLFNALYGQSHLMNFAQDCRDAVQEAGKHDGHYCYNGGMYNWLNLQVADYDVRSTCRENLPTFGR
jgi:hypothetical protein